MSANVYVQVSFDGHGLSVLLVSSGGNVDTHRTRGSNNVKKSPISKEI